MKRDELEDAVWDLPVVQSSGIDFDTIRAMSDAQLLVMLRSNDPDDGPQVKAISAVKTTRERWFKVSDTLEMVSGKLCNVQTWTSSYGHSKQHVTPCGKRVVFEGMTRSTTLVEHYLTTGEWIKRVPKPVRHRAVARVNGKVMHLGYFDTIQERDAAVVFAKSMAHY